MVFLFILFFASIITACVVAVKKIIKSREVSVLTVTSILNVLFFILIFIFAK